MKPTLDKGFRTNGRSPPLQRRSFLGDVAIVFAVCALVGEALGGSFLFETAALGKTGQAGGVAVSDQVLGARFYVDRALQVEEVGGHILGRPPSAEDYGTVFVAIVSLSGPAALPADDPGSLSVVAFTTFQAPFPSQDILVPLSVSLEPGYYGLIFGGSGLFGSSGEGSMPDNNTEIPTNVSYFFWPAGSTKAWLNTSPGGTRFVIKGTAAAPADSN